MIKKKPYSELYKSAPEELRKWARDIQAMGGRVALLDKMWPVVYDNLRRESNVMAIKYGPGRYS